MNSTLSRQRGSLLLLSLILLLSLTCQFFSLSGKDTLKRGSAFSPTENMFISGGEYQVKSINIPKDVTVEFDGAVMLSVEGDVQIDGEIVAQCANVQLDVGGNFNMAGKINNECNAETEEPSDISIQIMGDQVSFGTDEGISGITSSGDIEIVVGPKLEPWQYNLFDSEYSKEKLPPVCSATADEVFEVVDEDNPAEITFNAQGIDPDGGPVNLTWHFARINGDTIAGEGTNPVQKFDQEGLYVIHLTGTDDEGDMCTEAFHLAINDLDNEETFDFGLAIEQTSLTAAVEEPIIFYPNVFSGSGEDLEYRWEVNGEVSTEEILELSFGQPGRYDIYLDARDDTGFGIGASSSVYIYPQQEWTSTTPLTENISLQSNFDCTTPDPETIYFRKGWLSRGRNIRIDILPTSAIPVIFFPGVELEANDGKSWNTPKVGKGLVVGKSGGRGGSVLIRNHKFDLVFCGGTTLIAGNGGNGQEAISTDNANSRDGYAIGGYGGKPGNISLRAFSKIVIQGPGNLELVPGNGGDGGKAIADGGKGKDDCISPKKGGKAMAIGGKGGSAYYMLKFKINARAGGNIVVENYFGKDGNAGKGGDAYAAGGKGGNVKKSDGEDCDQANATNGATGGRADARSGKGGTANIKGFNGRVFATFKGGDGGKCFARGGDGGGGANRNSENSGTHGGSGGTAKGIAGKGGSGMVNGANGTCDPDSQGGNGGSGGNGRTTGGNGGNGGKGIGEVKDGKPGVNGTKNQASPRNTPTAQAGTTGKPEITAIEFPIGEPRKINKADNDCKIPADGTQIWGIVRFRSENDISSAWFDALDEWTIFSDFGFEITELYDGNSQQGAFDFWLSCDKKGFYSFGVTIKDKSENWSRWAVFMFECQ